MERLREGDIVSAKKLNMRQKMTDKKKNKDLAIPDDMVDPENSLGSHVSHSGVSSDGENHYEHKKDAFWDSSLLSESMSVLNEFFKKKEKKCKICEHNNPKITKPTFGWFHVVRSI